MRRLLGVTVVAACGSSQPPVQSQPQPHGPVHAEQQHQHGHHTMHHRFEKAEDWVPMFDDPARDEWQKPELVVAAMQIAPGMVVADIGAGTGYFEAKLAGAVGTTGKVLAIDVEPDMVRYMRERFVNNPNIEPRVGKPDDPGLGTGTVDRILIVDTWHHIGNRDDYAKKLATALRPGGFMLVVDFDLDTEKGPPKNMRLAPAAVIAELEQAGLRGRVLEDAGLPDQYIIRAER